MAIKKGSNEQIFKRKGVEEQPFFASKSLGLIFDFLNLIAYFFQFFPYLTLLYLWFLFNRCETHWNTMYVFYLNRNISAQNCFRSTLVNIIITTILTDIATFVNPLTILSGSEIFCHRSSDHHTIYSWEAHVLFPVRVCWTSPSSIHSFQHSRNALLKHLLVCISKDYQCLFRPA